jgi:hypothetical protein
MLFYHKLTQVFLEDAIKTKRITDADIAKFRKNPNEIWTANIENPFQSHGAGSNTYFFVKYQTINRNPNNKANVVDEAFSKALAHLGFTAPKKSTEGDFKGKVEHQWAAFKEKYANEIPEPSEDKTFREVADMIKEFYQCITLEKYKDAWKLLSLGFRNRKSTWGGDFKKFKRGYANTFKIVNVTTLNYNKEYDSLVSCLLVYDDNMTPWTLDELFSSPDLKLKDIDKFCDIVNSLRERLQKSSIKEYDDKIELHKVFEANVTDYIAYRCDFDNNKLPAIFPKRQSATVKRVMKCTCILEKKQWRIHKLIAEKVQHLR